MIQIHIPLKNPHCSLIDRCQKTKFTSHATGMCQILEGMMDRFYLRDVIKWNIYNRNDKMPISSHPGTHNSKGIQPEHIGKLAASVQPLVKGLQIGINSLGNPFGRSIKGCFDK